jgi:hypothetical protein
VFGNGYGKLGQWKIVLDERAEKQRMKEIFS